ncbi:hypothetical protein SDC9_99746 [bioreactor metagenome]|uniref:Uncharacterized protein n=1 Tax=bioreactor metagenome TaxID=1076179 RepID=A0A645AID4_9ZZZZ
MGVLGDHPFLLRGRDSRFIKKALGFCPSKYRLTQINAVIEDRADGGGMPVKRLSPVITVLVVIRIVLIKIRLRVQNTALPQDFCHSHIADAIGKHLEDLTHNVCGRRINDQFVPVVRIFAIPKRCAAADKHSGFRPRPVCRLCFAGRLPCVEGIDDVGEWKNEIIDAVF